MLTLRRPSLGLWPLLPAPAVLAAALALRPRADGRGSRPAGPADRAHSRLGRHQVGNDPIPGRPSGSTAEYFDSVAEGRETPSAVELMVWPESMFPWAMVDASSRGRKSRPDTRGATPSWARVPRVGKAVRRHGLACQQLGVPLLLGVGRVHCGRTASERSTRPCYVEP